MSDLAMYDSLASLAIARCRQNVQLLRRSIFDLERQAAKATSAEHKAGLETIATKLRAHLDTLSQAGADAAVDPDNAERYP